MHFWKARADPSFLHHEELYHSTPETQTDESYNHPEDLAHFRHHEHIEAEEDARERKFEGLAADADLADEHKAHDPLEAAGHAAGDGPEAYAAQGKGPDVGGGQTWEEQTAEVSGEGVPAGVAGQTDGHGQQVLQQQGEPVEVDAGDAKADGYQQARFRDARAGRKVPPRRLGPDASAHKHRASAEERARADAPYSESWGVCARRGVRWAGAASQSLSARDAPGPRTTVTLTPRVQDARWAAVGRVLGAIDYMHTYMARGLVAVSFPFYSICGARSNTRPMISGAI